MKVEVSLKEKEIDYTEELPEETRKAAERIAFRERVIEELKIRNNQDREKLKWTYSI